MKRKLIATVLGTALFTTTGLGFGLAAAQKPKAGEAAKVKTYDFSGDTIDGELVKPDNEFIEGRKNVQHTSLIRIRTDFIREIVKSAEDL